MEIDAQCRAIDDPYGLERSMCGGILFPCMQAGELQAGADAFLN